MCQFLLCVRVGCFGRNPTVDDVGHLLCCVLGVLGLVQQFPILSGFGRTHSIYIDSFVPKLSEEFGCEHHRSNVARGDQEDFSSMGQLPQPEVVGLLIQQSRHRKFQWIASLDVQLLTECRLPNAFGKSQAIDLLVVIMLFVFLPMGIGIKAIRSGCFHGGMSSW